MSRTAAFATLGLDEDATEAEIRESFRRMCRIHHPDQFVSQGLEAVDDANKMIKRIYAAYELLKKN